MIRRALTRLAFFVAVAVLSWLILVTTASASEPSKCKCISHVERKDSVYWECQCPKNIRPCIGELR